MNLQVLNPLSTWLSAPEGPARGLQDYSYLSWSSSVAWAERLVVHGKQGDDDAKDDGDDYLRDSFGDSLAARMVEPLG